jgi:hypothetical protein
VNRLARYAAVSSALALLSDRRLGALVDGAPEWGASIGGTSAVVYVEGEPVFVKRIPLTDLERRPESVMSTANLFELPAFCHYGVGSPGFGAWRELAANVLATNWVLAGRTGAFPMLYHWRVLPGAPPPAEEYADVEAVVEYWGGSPAVRQRLDELAKASASVVLFAEYVPHNVAGWLAGKRAAGAEAVADACLSLARWLHTDLGFLAANGLLHFDTHLRNLLTDGDRLYLADLGLAVSPRFELSTVEREFVARNATHDQAYADRLLVNWLVEYVVGIPVPATGGPVERNAYVRRVAAGERPAGLTAELAELIVRHAPVAVAMNDFYWDLFGVSRDTPYPAETIARLAGPGRW